MSMVFVCEEPTLTFTEKALLVDGDGFVVPIWAPVALSFNMRSVIVADSSEERATVSVLIFTPSVEPVESVNEPSFALFVPAIIVWLPYPEYFVSVSVEDEMVMVFAVTFAVGTLIEASDTCPVPLLEPVESRMATVSPDV